jgi:hypothetical protein
VRASATPALPSAKTNSGSQFSHRAGCSASALGAAPASRPMLARSVLAESGLPHASSRPENKRHRISDERIMPLGRDGIPTYSKIRGGAILTRAQGGFSGATSPRINARLWNSLQIAGSMVGLRRITSCRVSIEFVGPRKVTNSTCYHERGALRCYDSQ